MKKLRFALPLLLAAAMLLGGCSKDDEENGSDIDVQSSAEISQTESESSSAESSAQSSAESVPEPVLVEFTDEDRELQKILSDLQEPTEEILHWYAGMVPPQTQALDFAFPQFGSDAVTEYVRIPDNFRARDDNSPFVMPVTSADMRKIMLEYFSEKCTEKYIQKIAPGTMTKNPGGTYSVTLADGAGQSSDDSNSTFSYPTFLEINGRLYYFNTIKPISLNINYETARIIIKTDDTIEFGYLHYSDQYLFDTKYKYEPFYSENALKGVLKYERGGWKLDSWES